MNALKEFYRRQMFFPSWVGLFLNPFYFARSGLRDGISRYASMLAGRLLDVGCGTKPYRALFKVHDYVGLDLASDEARQRGCADEYYDGDTFPFPDASFDAVLCNQVLEHVFNPSQFLGEIRRVMRPGGRLLLTVPFVWDEHEQPFDFARYSSFGLRALLEEHGLRILHHAKLGADASTLFQLTNCYLYKIVQRGPRAVRIALTVSVMAIVNILGLLARRLLPGNEDFYLDQLVVAEKPL